MHPGGRGFKSRPVHSISPFSLMNGAVLFSEELEYQPVESHATFSGAFPEELNHPGFQNYASITGLRHIHRYEVGV